jgi:hypothetical protein
LQRGLHAGEVDSNVCIVFILAQYFFLIIYLGVRVTHTFTARACSNEVTVALGADYFATMSVAQACELITRRVAHVDAQLVRAQAAVAALDRLATRPPLDATLDADASDDLQEIREFEHEDGNVTGSVVPLRPAATAGVTAAVTTAAALAARTPLPSPSASISSPSTASVPAHPTPTPGRTPLPTPVSTVVATPSSTAIFDALTQALLRFDEAACQREVRRGRLFFVFFFSFRFHFSFSPTTIFASGFWPVHILCNIINQFHGFGLLHAGCRFCFCRTIAVVSRPSFPCTRPLHPLPRP